MVVVGLCLAPEEGGIGFIWGGIGMESSCVLEEAREALEPLALELRWQGWGKCARCDAGEP